MWIGSDLPGEKMNLRNNFIRWFLCAAFLVAIWCPHARGDGTPATQPAIYVNHHGLVKLGWQLAAGGASFSKISTLAMIDLLHALNIHHIELSAEQAQRLDAYGVNDLIGKLKEVHMDVVSYGPIDFGDTETNARSNFEFAQKLKMKTIVAHLDGQSLEMLDKLANEYQINIAILNRVTAQGQLAPDDILNAIMGRSKRIGVCVDVAAWRAARFSPVDVVKKLNGHILEVHLTGFDNSDSEKVLAELKEQKFKGICSVECEPGDGAEERFAAEVTAFSKIVGQLSGLE
jgi:sugar phosphate isomerase/epimerase